MGSYLGRKKRSYINPLTGTSDTRVMIKQQKDLGENVGE